MKKQDLLRFRENSNFLAFSFFFLIIATFWLLKPLRTSEVIKSIDLNYYPLVKQGLIVVIPGILILYSQISKFFSRPQTVYFFATFFCLVNLLYWHQFENSESQWLKISFFYYVDAYIAVMVTLFWTYISEMNDLTSAKKSYWYIGTGGLLGGILGAFVSGWAAKALHYDIILIASFTVLLTVPVVALIERQTKMLSIGEERVDKQLTKIFTEGARIVFASKYLIGIMLVAGLYELTSTIVDYLFSVELDAHFDTAEALSEFQGKLFFTAQVLALLAQLFLTSFIHKLEGNLLGLLLLPSVFIIGATAFFATPILVVIACIVGGEAMLAYSVNQTSKEILYAPLNASAKRAGKAFIDIFAIRFFRCIGATILLLYTLKLQHHGYTHRSLMVVVFVTVLAWFLSIGYVSRKFQQKEITSRLELGQRYK